MKEKLGYTLKEAAALTGLSISTINRAIIAGSLRTVSPRIGVSPICRTLILPADLEAWFKRN